MAEFKKLSDVAVSEKPADSANVLIEENGVIKKAPKTAVGGGNVALLPFPSNGNYEVPAPDGLYDKIKDMFDNNVCIDIIACIINNDPGSRNFERYPIESMHIADDGSFIGWSGSFMLQVYPNGLMDFYYND